MNLQDLHTLLDYHYWARDRVLDASRVLTPEQFTRDLGSSFGSVRDTLAHAYASEWAWYQRWQHNSPSSTLPFDQFPDVESIHTAWTEQEQRIRGYLASLDEPAITRLMEYTTLDGRAAAATFGDMLQHLVNHASYHRGQVVTLLRQLGSPAPKSMDMIAFFRGQPGRR